MAHVPHSISNTQSSTEPPIMVTANYNKFSEHVRRITPEHIQCSLFCGGVNCKYENPELWTGKTIAIQGLYSNWITNDILAMARPTTMLIVQKNLLQQFQSSLGIKSIINLQCPNEHHSCGQPLEVSGFAYDPAVFMENNFYYYNFSWKDYGDATIAGLLDMVKVVAFALLEGRVAIHCHAGLGRTGVLIACYLIYALRVPATMAIKYVRTQRSGSIQTRGQIICIRRFAHYILPKLITYYLKCPFDKDMRAFSLPTFLKRQTVALHGYEQRFYKFLPKIVHKLCQRILRLTGINCEAVEQLNVPITNAFLYAKSNLTSSKSYERLASFSISLDSFNDIDSETATNLDSTDIAIESPRFSISQQLLRLEKNANVMENTIIEKQNATQMEEPSISKNIIPNVENMLVKISQTDVEQMSTEEKQTLRLFKEEINSSAKGWADIEDETNISLLTALLFDWLESLKQPVLDRQHLERIVIYYKQPKECFDKFDQNSAYLLEYLLLFLSKLQTSNEEIYDKLLKRFLAALTQQCVSIQDCCLPEGRNFGKLREGTLNCAITFLKELSKLIEEHQQFYMCNRICNRSLVEFDTSY